MIVPSTRLFSAGEVETGAYLNSAVTNLGNFVLGKPVCSLYSTVATAVAALLLSQFLLLMKLLTAIMDTALRQIQNATRRRLLAGITFREWFRGLLLLVRKGTGFFEQTSQLILMKAVCKSLERR